MSVTTVLIVEDEPLIQDLLETVLVDEGFAVVTVSDGAAALAKIEADLAAFRAVITDIKLGDGPSGWDLARRAREISAGMPVLYMSGDSVDDWPAHGVPNSVMIAKPFAVAQIVTAVATLINDADMRSQ